MWIEVIFFRGAKPPKGAPWWPKNHLESTLVNPPCDSIQFSFFTNGFKNGIFYRFQAQPRRRAGLAERSFFDFWYHQLQSQKTFSVVFNFQLEHFTNGHFQMLLLRGWNGGSIIGRAGICRISTDWIMGFDRIFFSIVYVTCWQREIRGFVCKITQRSTWVKYIFRLINF